MTVVYVSMGSLCVIEWHFLNVGMLMLGSPNVNNFKTNPSSHEVHYSWCIFGISFSQFGSRGIFYFFQSCHLPLTINRYKPRRVHDQIIVVLCNHGHYYPHGCMQGGSWGSYDPPKISKGPLFLSKTCFLRDFCCYFIVKRSKNPDHDPPRIFKRSTFF